MLCPPELELELCTGDIQRNPTLAIVWGDREDEPSTLILLPPGDSARLGDRPPFGDRPLFGDLVPGDIPPLLGHGDKYPGDRIAGLVPPPEGQNDTMRTKAENDKSNKIFWVFFQQFTWCFWNTDRTLNQIMQHYLIESFL